MALQITGIFNNNCWPGRYGLKPRFVILHGTAGSTSAEAIANYFASTQGTSNPVSSHYVVGQDGQIVQCVSENDAAWCNGVVTGTPLAGLGFRAAGDGVHRDPWWSDSQNPNPNNIGIGIEICKPSDDNSDALTPAQEASVFGLVDEICDRWGIPKRFAVDESGGITGHFSMDPVNRSRCPGPFNWDGLWARFNSGGSSDMLQITDAFAAQYFVDLGGNPQRWHCPKMNIDVIGGILDAWRRSNGILRLPRTNEIYGVLPGDASFQVFEAGVIVWDPQYAVDNPGQGPAYAMHLDSDTPGLRRLMDIAGIKIALPSGLSTQQIDAAASTIQSTITALDASKAGLQNALHSLGK